MYSLVSMCYVCFFLLFFNIFIYLLFLHKNIQLSISSIQWYLIYYVILKIILFILI